MNASICWRLLRLESDRLGPRRHGFYFLRAETSPNGNSDVPDLSAGGGALTYFQGVSVSFGAELIHKTTQFHGCEGSNVLKAESDRVSRRNLRYFTKWVSFFKVNFHWISEKNFKNLSRKKVSHLLLLSWYSSNGNNSKYYFVFNIFKLQESKFMMVHFKLHICIINLAIIGSGHIRKCFHLSLTFK